MGIQIKFNFNDAKDELNVIVQNKQGEKRKTLLDVLVPLVTPAGDHVSDIDDCTNEDLLVHRSQNKRTWNSLNLDDDLEKALGEELGIEINNITGNVTPRRVNDPRQHMSPVSAATSIMRKCQLSESEEEEILSTEAGEDDILESANQVVDSMVGTNETDENLISDATENPENIETEAENIAKDRLRNENHSIPCDDHAVPSTSASNKKDVPDNSNSKSSQNNVNSRSTSKEQECTPQSDSEFIIEEVMDLDCIEETEGWSNDGKVNDKCDEPEDGPSFVDLTADRENRDPRLKKRSTNSVISTTDAESCYEQERVVTLHDYSDDDDEVGSQYSSARRSPRLRVRSDATRASFDTDFHDSRLGASDPHEDIIETIYDDYEPDECKYVPQVVDLTSERGIEFVDLTSASDRRSGASSPTNSQPIVLKRSERDVMEDLKNFYVSNKNAIAQNKEALRAFGLSYNKKVNCAEAPPKASNGLFGKRSATDCDDPEVKFSRLQPRSGGSACRVGSGPWSGLRERDANARSRPSAAVRPLNEKPKQTCGPAGYRLDDDLDPPKAPSPRAEDEEPPEAHDDEYDEDDSYAVPRSYHYGGQHGGRHRAFYASRQRMQQRRGRGFAGHFQTRRFPRKHPSPLYRRHHGNSGRTLRPTRQRGKGVWVQ